MKQNLKSQQSGFTIIELMIATTVLSVILVMVSVIMISIGSLYFKGLNQSRVQGNVRAIVDEISQQLQYNSTPPLKVTVGSTSALCIGDTRYTYVENLQIIKETQHVLWRDKVIPNECNSVANPLPDLSSAALIDGAELIAPGSRLTKFDLDTTSSPYEFTVGVAYGDSDLLQLAGTDTNCMNVTGRQFCSTAFLKTTVLKRL